MRAFWTPPAAEWNVVDRVLAPGGRAFVAWSLMGPETHAAVEEAVRPLAGERGFVLVRVHRGMTGPIPSVALELGRSA